MSFAATGESFDPDRDLELIHNEPVCDKRPGFLAGIPSYGKREVYRAAANHGVTGRAQYEVSVYGQDASVSITDTKGELAEKPHFTSTLPPRGSLLGSRRALNSVLPLRQGPTQQPAVPAIGRQMTNLMAPEPPRESGYQSGLAQAPIHQFGGFQPPSIPDPYVGLPDNVRLMMGLAPRSERGGTGFDPADFGGYGPNSRGDRYGVLEPMDAIAEQRARTQRQNEQIQRDREEMQQRIRMQTELLMHARREVFYGKDLKPCLTPAGEEYSKLHPRQPVNELPFGRNYMAGLGLWLSRVGWEQQMAGEHPYGYANNNPTAVFDPSGLSPCPMLGDDPCDQYPHVPGYWDKQESVRHLLTCRRSPQTLGVETDRWSSCFPFSIENRHSLGC